MKIQDFKEDLTNSLRTICREKAWQFDNSKQRGMAFEDWCFNLFAERYPTAEAELDQCVIRGDDFNIDIIFESKETEEIYILQCKHPKIAASDPIPEDEVKSFFSTYALLKDNDYLDQRNTNNPKIIGLGDEFAYWQKQNFTIHFIFLSNGRAHDKTSALVEKYNRDHQIKECTSTFGILLVLKMSTWQLRALSNSIPKQSRFR
jgi:hypothetical protein